MVRKIFFHFYEEVIFNAHVFHCKNNIFSKKTYLQFKLDAIRKLLSDADLDYGLQNGTDRLNGRHFNRKAGKEGKTAEEMHRMLQERCTKGNVSMPMPSLDWLHYHTKVLYHV